ncbi:MAG: hypothetical protein V2A77_12170 [Pseudomonadota bacterium]
MDGLSERDPQGRPASTYPFFHSFVIIASTYLGALVSRRRAHLVGGFVRLGDLVCYFGGSNEINAQSGSAKAQGREHGGPFEVKKAWFFRRRSKMQSMVIAIAVAAASCLGVVLIIVRASARVANDTAVTSRLARYGGRSINSL